MNFPFENSFLNIRYFIILADLSFFLKANFLSQDLIILFKKFDYQNSKNRI